MMTLAASLLLWWSSGSPPRADAPPPEDMKTQCQLRCHNDYNECILNCSGDGECLERCGTAQRKCVDGC